MQPTLLNAIRNSNNITILFYDSFTDIANTLLTAHTPDIAVAGGWTFQAGKSFSITATNRAVATVVQSLAWANVNQSAVTVTDTISDLDTNNNRGVAVRLSDANNYWRIDLANGTTFRIVQIQGGGPIVRASLGVVYASGATGDFRVVTAGNTITAYVAINGGAENMISYGAATFNNTATRYGIYSQTINTKDIHDNFKVVL